MAKTLIPLSFLVYVPFNNDIYLTESMFHVIIAIEIRIIINKEL